MFAVDSQRGPNTPRQLKRRQSRSIIFQPTEQIRFISLLIVTNLIHLYREEQIQKYGKGRGLMTER